MFVRSHCQPAARVIAALGGVTRTAQLLDLPKSNVSRWASENGLNGRIPKKHHAKILELCHAFGYELTSEELV